MARIIAILVTLLIAVFELCPGTGSAISGQPEQALLAGAAVLADAPGRFEARASRRCFGSFTSGTGSKCQIDKHLSDPAPLPCPRYKPMSYAADFDAFPRSRDPAPDHGPPRQLA